MYRNKQRCKLLIQLSATYMYPLELYSWDLSLRENHAWERLVLLAVFDCL